MAKKTDISSLKGIGMGILDTISEIDEQKSKSINNENGSKVKGQRSKRSFMLTETTIQRLNLLKLCMSDKDLSSIVEDSVSMYFEKNKDSIEALISIYNKVK